MILENPNLVFDSPGPECRGNEGWGRGESGSGVINVAFVDMPLAKSLRHSGKLKPCLECC